MNQSGRGKNGRFIESANFRIDCWDRNLFKGRDEKRGRRLDLIRVRNAGHTTFYKHVGRSPKNWTVI